MPHIRSGRMHALAVTSQKRSFLAPEVATVQEQGLKQPDISGWYAIIAPAAIKQRLSEEIFNALKSPLMRDTMVAGSYEPVGSTPKELAQHIDAEITRWAAVIKSTNAQID